MIDATTGLDAAPDATPVEESGSLADFEAQFRSGATLPQESGSESDAEPDETAEPIAPSARNDKGQFVQQRHRAKSQQASADDVATIAALTKRINEAEDSDGKDITRAENESERVYKLRRRAELAERRKMITAPPAAPARPATVVPPVVQTQASATPPKPRLDDEQWKTHEEFVEALADWKFDRRMEQRQQEETAAKQKEQQASHAQQLAGSWNEKVTAAKVKYPDFQAKALDAPTSIPENSLIDRWILEHKAGADVLYHLQTHPTEVTALLRSSDFEQVEALALLSQRLTTPTSETAVSTGAASRQVSPPPTPRPPTPVRTGSMRTADEPVDPADVDLGGFAKAFPIKRR